ncbi:CHAP domain-containing protein [Actinomadura rayongensis]|uniref:CHAP domain-containing protein n=1 Tax=Actinomadura rayongensis TaxID=1429076 RepID=A0A6I4WFA3_9ACTN|nr:CHAP domain-containing protein [Actinomadura rayongensis]MXQ67723.1 CHAP domain-containing protein [Actinomadura rayongensis]
MSKAGMLTAARSQLGYREKGDGYTKFGDWYAETLHAGSGFVRASWCDMFITWCAAQSGNTAAVTGGKGFAYTPFHASWFVKAGRWGTKPKVGAIVFYDWGGSRKVSAIDHVGIVEAVHSDGSVTTIEGNTANAVMRRRRAAGIVGYGYPAYPGEGGGSAPGKPKPGTGKAPKWPGIYLKTGTRGAAVKSWQTQMRKRGWRLAADGVYGAESRGVCEAFQAEKHLRVDGVVGPQTWAAAWTAPIT